MRQLQKLILAGFIIFTGLQCNKDSGNSDSFNAAAPGNGTGTGGSTARFTIVGNYLYTVDKEKLKVFSIINPADPVIKNTQDIGFEIETIFPFGDKLFIGSTSVIHIFSIANPENPQKLSTAISPSVMRRCDPVVAKDTVAYATLRTNGPCGGISSQLVAFDIHDIMNPVQKAFLTVNEPYGLGYADTVLYVCDRTGLYLFNIAKAYQLQYIRTFPGNWYLDVIPYGNTLICWDKDGMILYDISNRISPQFIAKII
jgi:hypothetical protein